MNKKLLVKPIAAIIGATVLTALSGITPAAAEQNPFASAGLGSGYVVAADESAAGNEAATPSQSTPAPAPKKKRAHKKKTTGTGATGGKQPMEGTKTQ